MIVFPPIQIDDDRFVSSSVPEPDVANGEQEWQANKAYTIGQPVVRSTLHRKYRALVDMPHGDAIPPESAPLKWQRVGASNRWAMFEHGRSNETIGHGGHPLTFSFRPGKRVDSVALIGVIASKATLRIYDDTGALQYEQSRQIAKRIVNNWFDYFFAPFAYQGDVLFLNLPPYNGARMEVELIFGDEPPRLKACIVCRKVDFGKTAPSATVSGANYSRIDRSQEYGEVSAIVERRIVPSTKQEMVIRPHQVDEIREAMRELRATPALFSGLDDRVTDPWFASFLIYGIVKDWSITPHSGAWRDLGTLKLDLEEL